MIDQYLKCLSSLFYGFCASFSLVASAVLFLGAIILMPTDYLTHVGQMLHFFFIVFPSGSIDGVYVCFRVWLVLQTHGQPVDIIFFFFLSLSFFFFCGVFWGVWDGWAQHRVRL